VIRDGYTTIAGMASGIAAQIPGYSSTFGGSLPSNQGLPPTMGTSPTIPLICGLLLLLGWQVRGLLAQIHRLEQLIQDSREREQELIDRMLTKSGFAPIIEREQVVKLADPED
jgi:hypothetical protein